MIEDKQPIIELLNKLRNGELQEYHVSKEQFLAFRSIFVNQVDFKRFRGIAQRGGDVVFRYTEDPTRKNADKHM